MTTRTARLYGGPVVAMVVVTLLMVTMTGCNNGGAGNLPPPPSPRHTAAVPASTVDPTDQAILDAYRGSVLAMVAAQRAGNPDHPDLARFFVERTSAWNEVQNGIRRHDARGTYYTGQLVVVSAGVAALDLAAEPPAATVRSCLDDAGYQLVNRQDGSPAPDAGQGGRYSVTSQAILGNDGHWYIVDSIADWNEPC